MIHQVDIFGLNKPQALVEETYYSQIIDKDAKTWVESCKMF